jgi:hypothetical protein
VLDTGSRITVHVAFHAIKDPVTYSGEMAIPFMADVGGGGVRKVSAAVSRGGNPVNTSVTGGASSEPGSYDFSISVLAQRPGKPDMPIAANVKVVVRQPTKVDG